ncbi:hypothetical protein T265_08779 [Opisthorchis viverrini]|uniref:Uncharacterized protein n=1 Tax=Opisthorchis viverrini TaxID=6198 RepID=A0A074Z860_OPIVI|nr:hypothetical protein T265_08779 [Opisthorchis viverrini]KER23293.1 hypothetical protein T265_08779 [Opisthorchis viverrini]
MEYVTGWLLRHPTLTLGTHTREQQTGWWYIDYISNLLRMLQQGYTYSLLTLAVSLEVERAFDYAEVSSFTHALLNRNASSRKRSLGPLFRFFLSTLLYLMPANTRHALLLSFYFFLVAPFPELQSSTAVAQTPLIAVIRSNWLVSGLHSHGPPTKGKLSVSLHLHDSLRKSPSHPQPCVTELRIPSPTRDDRYGAVHKPKHACLLHKSKSVYGIRVAIYSGNARPSNLFPAPDFPTTVQPVKQRIALKTGTTRHIALTLVINVQTVATGEFTSSLSQIREVRREERSEVWKHDALLNRGRIDQIPKLKSFNHNPLKLVKQRIALKTGTTRHIALTLVINVQTVATGEFTSSLSQIREVRREERSEVWKHDALLDRGRIDQIPKLKSFNHDPLKLVRMGIMHARKGRFLARSAPRV